MKFFTFRGLKIKLKIFYDTRTSFYIDARLTPEVRHQQTETKFGGTYDLSRGLRFCHSCKHTSRDLPGDGPLPGDPPSHPMSLTPSRPLGYVRTRLLVCRILYKGLHKTGESKYS